MNIRAGDTAVEDIADDCDLETGDSLFMFADRHRVKQGLCRVLVGPITGIDDRRAADLSKLMRHSGTRMTDHDAVGGHRVEIHRSVEQRLAFADAGRRNTYIDRIR